MGGKVQSLGGSDLHIDPDGTKTKQIQEKIEAMQNRILNSGLQPEWLTNKASKYEGKNALEKIQLQLEDLQQFESEEHKRKLRIFSEEKEVCVERMAKIKDRSR